jgi:hypothetical protein
MCLRICLGTCFNNVNSYLSFVEGSAHSIACGEIYYGGDFIQGKHGNI